MLRLWLELLLQLFVGSCEFGKPLFKPTLKPIFRIIQKYHLNYFQSPTNAWPPRKVKQSVRVRAGSFQRLGVLPPLVHLAAATWGLGMQRRLVLSPGPTPGALGRAHFCRQLPVPSPVTEGRGEEDLPIQSHASWPVTNHFLIASRKKSITLPFT